jgi:dGTP triphosphohydrolase
MAQPLADYKVVGEFDKHIDKIMNTYYFRKLAGKTQVILSLAGPTVRTRLTHTVEVARIAREICERLSLNSGLAEAIALAHDIGHTPFGHVGERTLREVMCGCDTLDEKIPDLDFDNSGFKHNLQSFRVLANLEMITDGIKMEKWPYILWGVPIHSKMTYSKSYSGIEEEINISCKHCEAVYSCYFHKRLMCKRNIQKKKDRKYDTKKEICKPWYCAILKEVKNAKTIKSTDLKDDQTTEEYIREGNLQKKDLPDIFCSQKCYMAKLWANKIKNLKYFNEFNYLFDHPFPNVFYAKYLSDYFFEKKKMVDYISIEALVVRQADEIAQRQQDLEDGISKKLISVDNARTQVKTLIKAFNENNSFGDLLRRINVAKNQKDLGEIIVIFYERLLIECTKSNFEKFSSSHAKENINIYCLTNILYSIHGNVSEKTKWLLQELNYLLTGGKTPAGSRYLERYFNIDTNEIYLHLLIYDYLDRYSKKNIYDFDLMSHFSDYLESTYKYTKATTIGPIHQKTQFLRELDGIRTFTKNTFLDEYDDFMLYAERRKDNWKNITHLNLFHFYIAIKLSKKLFGRARKSIITASNLDGITFSNDREYDAPRVFTIWIKQLKNDANRTLAKVVDFISDNDVPEKIKKKKDALEKFENHQKSAILKSETVEKNDGKANYILKRLFKAYISNSHQLSDEGLKLILIALTDNDTWTAFLKSESNTFRDILFKLKKTMKIIDVNKLQKIAKSDFMRVIQNSEIIKKLKWDTSNEIVALLDGRVDLYMFLNDVRKKRKSIKNSLKNSVSDDNGDMRRLLIDFRRVLDNAILNAIPIWKAILTRGVCDYISSLTDQEAINEYEKLYAGIMELV